MKRSYKTITVLVLAAALLLSGCSKSSSSSRRSEREESAEVRSAEVSLAAGNEYEDVETIEMEGKMVVAIQVPRADYNVRPVYINNNLMTGTYRRNHEGDYHCPKELIKMMMRDAFDDGNDRMFLKHYTMDDIDIPTLEQYRNHFSSRYPQHVFNKLDHKEFLRQLGGYTTDREEGMEGLTMAGLLMFGKGLLARDSPYATASTTCDWTISTSRT